ncbi:MAG TPA: outer membrane lipoprotein-sorting protein [Bryobacteraceae bacterium]|jgi:outer membrane lipoprotein-sorting protein
MKIAFSVLCLFVGALLHAQSVDAVLSRMDKAAPGFHSMAANVKMTTHTAIINDTNIESGTFKMQRLKGDEVRAVLDFSGQTDSRQIGFLGKLVRIYYPKLNSYQDYDLGRNTDVLNQFLLLGFGSSGRDLAAAYTITSEGPEKLDGHDTTKLSLVPKNPEVAKRLSKIEMWIPNDAAYPVQQEFYEPSGNYRIVSYSDINLKPSIRGKLELKMPAGVKKQSS